MEDAAEGRGSELGGALVLDDEAGEAALIGVSKVGRVPGELDVGSRVGALELGLDDGVEVADAGEPIWRGWSGGGGDCIAVGGDASDDGRETVDGGTDGGSVDALARGSLVGDVCAETQLGWSVDGCLVGEEGGDLLSGPAELVVDGGPEMDAPGHEARFGCVLVVGERGCRGRA
ncbi:hypothetical protein L1887_53417 [Cichorium endivia]|nr:hypothetical protein L1887_53417 [Cichorium endivia]